MTVRSPVWMKASTGMPGASWSGRASPSRPAGLRCARVVGHAGPLVDHDLRRDAGHLALDLRRGARVEGREAQDGDLLRADAVDVLRLDLHLDGQEIDGDDLHDRLAGGDHSSDRVDGELVHAPVLRRADVDAAELVLCRGLALQELGDLALHLAQLAGHFAAQVLSIWMICSPTSVLRPLGLRDGATNSPCSPSRRARSRSSAATRWMVMRFFSHSSRTPLSSCLASSISAIWRRAGR